MDVDTIKAILESDDTSELDAYLTQSEGQAAMLESGNAKVAELEAANAALAAELQATKAHNYDLIQSATTAPNDDGDTDGSDTDDDTDDDSDDESLDDYL